MYYVFYLPYPTFVVAFFINMYADSFRILLISVPLAYVHIHSVSVQYCFTRRLLSYVLWLHFNFTETDLTGIPNTNAFVLGRVFKQYGGKNPVVVGLLIQNRHVSQ